LTERILVKWLEEKGVIDFARHIRTEYLTGTAITIIVVLLVLLVRPGSERAGFFRRCPVCDHTIVGRENYCAGCGSRV
jgi:hypothetical protein